VAFCEDHGGVEADDGEEAGDVEDGLDDVLADGGLGVVELGGVVPGEGGAVVAVVDVAGLAGGVVAEAEGYGGVGLIVIMVFDFDFDAGVAGEVGAVEAVGGEGRFPAVEEPVGVFDDPVGVDAHVVGDHVAGEAEPGGGGVALEVVVGLPSAEVAGDVVAFERVGGGDGIVVAAQALDGLGCGGALPKADEPEASDAAMGEEAELFVGDLVEAEDVAAIFFGELLQPDVGALGDEDDVGHPGLVGGEVFVFIERGLIAVAVAAQAAEADVLVALETLRAPGGRAVAVLIGAGGVEAHPDGEVFFAQDVDGEEDAAEVGADEWGPALADEVELAGEGIGRGEEGRTQGVEEGADGGERRTGAEEVGKGRRDVGVDGLLLEAGVFEEGVKWFEGGIGVGDPEEEEFFEGGFAVGQTIGCAAEPLGGGELATEDGGVGELFGEGEEEQVEFCGLELRGEPADGLG
jgi:hypothetical protein